MNCYPSSFSAESYIVTTSGSKPMSRVNEEAEISELDGNLNSEISEEAIPTIQ